MKTSAKSSRHITMFGKNAFRQRVCTSKKKNALRVLIADDHPHLIAGLKEDLKRDKEIKIVGYAGSYNELLLKVDFLQPNVVLLDLKMPGYESHDLKEFITKLKAINHCKVIIFSNETGWARIQRCLEFGACGYIEKAISLGKLAEFIHKVYKDEELIVCTADELPRIDFSYRQKQILHYMADGIENDGIANLLGIGIKSVQSYVDVLRSKIEESFGIKPIRPRMLMFLASRLGFGSKFR